MTTFTEIRMRSKVADEDIVPMVGKILTDNEYDLLLKGPTSIVASDDRGGTRQLLKYLPGAFSAERMETFYGTLHSLKGMETTNRGLASGSQRVKKFEESSWSYSKPVASAIIGAFDPLPPKQYCRLTAWSGKEADQFSGLFPLFQDIGALFAEHVPDRYAAQMSRVAKTKEEWLIPNTPFTTITVNNTYPTGVHTDKGDLDEGFSTLAVLRRGEYTGGYLTFPQWRVAVDMQDGDVLLMDAHEWHGNTTMTILDPQCVLCSEKATVIAHFYHGTERQRPLCEAHGAQFGTTGAPNLSFEDVVPAERISVVSYYRTRMEDCGTAEEEITKAQAWAEKRIGIGIDAADAWRLAQVEEMASEASG